MNSVFSQGSTLEINTVLLTTIVVAIVMGVFRGIDFIINKYRGNSLPKTSPNEPNWINITGEVRPVTLGECKANHASFKEDIKEDLRKGSERFDRLSSEQIELKEAVLELKGEVREGFASVKSAIISTVETGIDRHEGRYHRSRPSDRYTKP